MISYAMMERLNGNTRIIPKLTSMPISNIQRAIVTEDKTKSGGSRASQILAKLRDEDIIPN